MSPKDGSYVKKMRMDEIAKRISKEFPHSTSFEAVVLWAKVNIGLTRGKAEEYVSDVVASHGWVLEGDEIKPELEEAKEE